MYWIFDNAMFDYVIFINNVTIKIKNFLVCGIGLELRNYSSFATKYLPCRDFFVTCLFLGMHETTEQTLFCLFYLHFFLNFSFGRR